MFLGEIESNLFAKIPLNFKRNLETIIDTEKP